MASVAIVLQEVPNEFCIVKPLKINAFVIYCTFLLHSKDGDTNQQVNIAGIVTLQVISRNCVYKRENPKETGDYTLIRRPNWVHEDCYLYE